MAKKDDGQNLATCKRCGVRYGAPGPCPSCCPPNAFELNTAAHEAFKLHDMEFRNGRDRSGGKNGPNYICHPAEVVVQLWEWGYDADRHGSLFVTGWLHDGPENQRTADERQDAFKGIAAHTEFEPVVLPLVEQMTWDKKKDAKTVYLSTFLDPAKTYVEAVIAKHADRCRNIRSFLFGDRDLEPRDRYAYTYLRQGEPIFEAVNSRQDQIVEYAGRGYSDDQAKCRARGVKIYGRMINTVEKLKIACKYEDDELDLL